jgi:YVTN family beta-propeller protein
MLDNKEKIIYYVSNLGNDKVSIIDGQNYNLIKEIHVGARPHEIIVDEKNNVYIASDREAKVTLIDDLYQPKKSWHMPNNGNIQVDAISNKIYVCDTEEICIYNTLNGEKLHCISGFVAANCIKLDKDKKRLFVLDILQNEISVFDTSDFNIIRVYKEVGIGPSYILLGRDERQVFISNKGVSRGRNEGNISVLELKSGFISYINLDRGSSVIFLELNENTLYALNNGLNRVDVIDIIKNEVKAFIEPTLPKLQRLLLSPNKKMLLLTCGDTYGTGAIDRIDTTSNTILGTFNFEEKNSMPYHIAVVTQENNFLEKELVTVAPCVEICKQEKEIAILAKKIISTYQEKVIFSDIIVKVPSIEQHTIFNEKVVFLPIEIVKDTKIRQVIENRKEYSVLYYDFFITYYIELKNKNNEKYFIEGKLEGKQKATLCIPNYAEQQGLEFVISSYSKVTSSSMIENNSVKFSVSALISTKVVIEDIVVIPTSKECERCRQKEEGT